MPTSTPVSVIIPAYNAERFVAEAVRSVLEQTHREVELLVVDDGSTDDTPRILESIGDPRLRVHRQPNAGVAHARNLGIARAGGELIAFLDADDVWARTKLARQLAALSEHPQWVAVGHLMHYITASGRVLGIAGERIGRAELTAVRAGRLMPFPLSSMLVRAPALKGVGGFDPQFASLGQVEDLDLLARLAASGEIGIVDEVLGGYRVHGASASARRFLLQRTGARYLAARLAARESGRDLTFAEFVQSRTWWRRLGAARRDLGAQAYRSAGLSLADRHVVRAILWAVPAAVLTPIRTAREFARQRGMSHGRSGSARS